MNETLLDGFSIDAKDLMRQFGALPDKVARKAGRKAVSAGGSVLRRVARAHTPERSGLTQKAIRMKTKQYRASDTSVAIVGVSDKVSGEVNGKRHWPFNIHHLIHEGHIATNGTFVPGDPYLKIANEEGGDPARTRMLQKLEQEIVKLTQGAP